VSGQNRRVCILAPAKCVYCLGDIPGVDREAPGRLIGFPGNKRTSQLAAANVTD
jgi:hypothetical protein